MTPLFIDRGSSTEIGIRIVDFNVLIQVTVFFVLRFSVNELIQQNNNNNMFSELNLKFNALAKNTNNGTYINISD